MNVSSEPKVYRSPLHKLLNFFKKSRDAWKAKCQAAKRKGKALANNVAALTKSRDRWKVPARQHRDEVEQHRRDVAVASGLYELTRPKPRADNWLLIFDHTVQLGGMKALVIVWVSN